MQLPVAFWRSPRFSSPIARGTGAAQASGGLAFPSLWTELSWPVKLGAAIVRYLRPGPADPDPPRSPHARPATMRTLRTIGMYRFTETLPFAAGPCVGPLGPIHLILEARVRIGPRPPGHMSPG